MRGRGCRICQLRQGEVTRKHWRTGSGAVGARGVLHSSPPAYQSKGDRDCCGRCAHITVSGICGQRTLAGVAKPASLLIIPVPLLRQSHTSRHRP